MQETEISQLSRSRHYSRRWTRRSGEFDTESADRVHALLAQLAPQTFPDAPSLIRFS